MGERDNNLNINASFSNHSGCHFQSFALLSNFFFSPFTSCLYSVVLKLFFLCNFCHFIALTFFLRCGSFFISSLLVGTAAVSLLLQDVADEDTQQAHHAEDGHQSKHGVLRRLLLSAAYHRAVDRPSGTAGWTFTHRADRSDVQRC